MGGAGGVGTGSEVRQAAGRTGANASQERLFQILSQLGPLDLVRGWLQRIAVLAVALDAIG